MALAIEDSPHGGYQKLDTRHYSMDDENDNFEGNANDEVRGWRSFSRMMNSGYRQDSALARGINITEFSDSRVNPTPLLLEESDILLEQYLSPGKLQLLTGVDDLKTVESLELKVDSRETSLGNFGSLLPNLVELKLNGSHIACVRDLGSSLRKLKVLWMTRCGLEELDGISAMSELKELYLEYNEISDVSPLSLLEHLEILDLEGNNIEDITQVQYLSLCPTLQNLALDGNPICVCPSPTHDKSGYDFRKTIKDLLPNLKILDDDGMDDKSFSARHNEFDEDWAYLEELQDEALLQEEFPEKHEVTQTGDRPPTAALRPATAYRPGSALRPSSGFRPASAPKRPSTASSGSSLFVQPGTVVSNRPVSSDAIEGIESVSELTMGNVICGNPSSSSSEKTRKAWLKGRH
uniref:U2A'/phosphoprotein 32 family A C-terminal domain-containing protein n=1 Tax=Arion vulgaris TaxID=1028688 RepID=A0A0B7A2Z2_9EUPU